MLTTVLILCVPVYSEVGTDRSHPHAMLQLLLEASGLTPLHHHAPDDGHSVSPLHSNKPATSAHDAPAVEALAYHPDINSTNSGEVLQTRSLEGGELLTLSPTSNLIGVGVIPRSGFSLPLPVLSSIIFGDIAHALTTLPVPPEPPPPRLS